MKLIGILALLSAIEATVYRLEAPEFGVAITFFKVRDSELSYGAKGECDSDCECRVSIVINTAVHNIHCRAPASHEPGVCSVFLDTSLLGKSERICTSIDYESRRKSRGIEASKVRTRSSSSFDEYGTHKILRSISNHPIPIEVLIGPVKVPYMVTCSSHCICWLTEKGMDPIRCAQDYYSSSGKDTSKSKHCVLYEQGSLLSTSQLIEGSKGGCYTVMA